MKTLILPLLSIILLLIISACAGSDSDIRPEFPDYGEKPRLTKVDDKSKSLPWEIWTPGIDPDGIPLAHPGILRGDEYAKEGLRARAYDEYRKVDRSRLMRGEEQALVIRLASMQTALAQPKKALDTISEYFHFRRKTADEVNAQFSVMLAFAYAESNDLNQAFAWFSKVHKMSAPGTSYDRIATTGIKSYLRYADPETFEKLSRTWTSDVYITQLIGQERELRARIGIATRENSVAVHESDLFSGQQPAAAGTSGRVAVLLPLSGRFSALGRNTKNGLELALGQSSPGWPAIEIVTRDDAGDTTSAVTQVRELSALVSPSVVIGPLLSDPASAAADAARQSGLPLLSFSKKGTFPTGDGIFRLGATAQSQVDSLLSITGGPMKISKYALVYQNDANGHEFANAFRSRISVLGLELLYEKLYNKDDYGALLHIAQELERYKVQAVFFPDNLLAASRFFSNFSPVFRQNVKLLGAANWDDFVQLARFQTIMDGAIFVSPFFARSQKPLVQKFVEAYKQTFGQDPDFLAAQGFDAGTMVASALRRSRSENIPFVRALGDINQYDGITGRISITATGEMARSYSLLEFKNGSLTELSLEPAQSAFTMRGNEIVDSAAAPASYGFAAGRPGNFNQ